MNFTEFKAVFQRNFAEMVKNADSLFEVTVDKDEFWNLYLDSFPSGTNEVFRERREHDCSCCRHFIKAIGHVVVISGNKVRTMWDFTTGDETYQTVINALDAYLKERAVKDFFVTKENYVGVDSNWERIDGAKSIKWDHFYLNIPDKFVDRSGRSIGDIQGSLRDVRNVFNRSLTEITEDAVMTVLELIASNTLYRGSEWKAILTKFLQYKRAFDKLPDEEKSNFAWENAKAAGETIGKIRNHSIGTLLIDISNGEDLDIAVKKYEKIVAPANYKRPKAIFTKKMLEDAKKTIADLGYMESLGRRFATLNDINVNNILFSNRDAAKRITGGMDVLDEMLSQVSSSVKKFSRVEEISIDKFVADVLPSAKTVEVYLENRHASNMVSLIAPKNPDAPTMFKWDNGFSWAYSGNITDSDITQRVQAAGGRTDGVLRFSHSWNYDGMRNASLMDLHVFMPGSNQPECHDKSGREIHDNYGNGERVGWNHRRHVASGGIQDVDYIAAAPAGYIPVENTTFPSMDKLRDGIYTFKIHNWRHRTPTNGGFKAELAFNGEVYQFVREKPLANKEWVTVAKLELKNGVFKILEMMECDTTPIDIWNLKTNQFVPVSVVMFSPNYWDEQTGIGHKHYMFMLKDCVNPENPNGFYNEFLKNELVQHKRVFEALGGKMAVESVEDQLSGLGFSSTKRNDLVVKVKGQTERIMRIKF